MRKHVLPIVAGLCLCACGGGRNDQAGAACAKVIAEKLAGKSFELDRADMNAHASAEADNVVRIASTATFDKGLPTEYKQTFECRARFDNTQAPSVISLQFNWNTADLRKAGN
jgi:hypothetical protein